MNALNQMFASGGKIVKRWSFIDPILQMTNNLFIQVFLIENGNPCVGFKVAQNFEIICNGHSLNI